MFPAKHLMVLRTELKRHHSGDLWWVPLALAWMEQIHSPQVSGWPQDQPSQKPLLWHHSQSTPWHPPAPVYCKCVWPSREESPFLPASCTQQPSWGFPVSDFRIHRLPCLTVGAVVPVQSKSLCSHPWQQRKLSLIRTQVNHHTDKVLKCWHLGPKWSTFSIIPQIFKKITWVISIANI